MIDGIELGKILCEMFGIDTKNVVAIEVIARIGHPAEVLLETRPDFSDGWTMEQTFRLVKHD
jgi:hypothetical protein